MNKLIKLTLMASIVISFTYAESIVYIDKFRSYNGSKCKYRVNLHPDDIALGKLYMGNCGTGVEVYPTKYSPLVNRIGRADEGGAFFLNDSDWATKMKAENYGLCYDHPKYGQTHQLKSLRLGKNLSFQMKFKRCFGN